MYWRVVPQMNNYISREIIPISRRKMEKVQSKLVFSSKKIVDIKSYSCVEIDLRRMPYVIGDQSRKKDLIKKTQTNTNTHADSLREGRDMKHPPHRQVYEFENIGRNYRKVHKHELSVSIIEM